MRGVLAGLTMRTKVLLFALVLSVASLMLVAGTSEAHGNYCGHATGYLSQYSRLKFVSHYSTHLGHIHRYAHQYAGARGSWFTDHYDRHNC